MFWYNRAPKRTPNNPTTADIDSENEHDDEAGENSDDNYNEVEQVKPPEGDKP